MKFKIAFLLGLFLSIQPSFAKSFGFSLLGGGIYSQPKSGSEYSSGKITYANFGLALEFGFDTWTGMEINGLYASRSFELPVSGTLSNRAYIEGSGLFRLFPFHMISLGAGGYYAQRLQSVFKEVDIGYIGSLKIRLPRTIFCFEYRYLGSIAYSRAEYSYRTQELLIGVSF